MYFDQKELEKHFILKEKEKLFYGNRDGWYGWIGFGGSVF